MTVKLINNQNNFRVVYRFSINSINSTIRWNLVNLRNEDFNKQN